ncbi:Uncharacterized oxidoreductase MexAM1_META1p0182; AltName: Full=ORFC [Serendipita indica DSM 11827]|nr:Uncharacterized oxidoreductase MexAM1_META1p0182; AltName: Full=ORFC [Serendipita indica DSM 11827]
MSLSGKVALVTGSARGIGAAIAVALAQQGAHVVINHVSSSSLSRAQEVARSIENLGTGSRTLIVQADLASLDELNNLVKQTVDHFGRIDILVNNGAVAELAPLEEVTVDHYQRMYDVNVRAVIFLTKAVVAHMKEGGNIINISSVSARIGEAGTTVYASTKAAVESVTRVLGIELRDRNIKVNAVSPGPVVTDTFKGLPEEAKASIRNSRPVAEPSDIADVVVFLASPASRWITGSTLSASNGVKAMAQVHNNTQNIDILDAATAAVGQETLTNVQDPTTMAQETQETPTTTTDALESMNTSQATPAVPAPIAPVPMSFPAILLNPKQRAPQLLRTRDAENTRSRQPSSTTIDGKTRGKRHVRRHDNGRFNGNPHIVHPSSSDYSISTSEPRETFPRPLPAYLPRVSPAPSGATISRADPANLNSAYAGRFTLGLRGVRKDLRHRGGMRARTLIQDIESLLQVWLDGDSAALDALIEERKGFVDSVDRPAIHIVSSTPMQLIWSVEDPFARWLVHCVARFHSVVSFSKDVSNGTTTERQTHLLRPNSRHPDPRAAAALYTPTATDLDSSVIDTDGDTSDYGGLVDSISSLQIVEASDLAHSTTLMENRIDEELSDAESSFSLIEHPDAREDASAIDAQDTTRPPRPMERIVADTNEAVTSADATVEPSMLSRVKRSGSDSSPSRSPMRNRNGRLRNSRRVLPLPHSRRAVYRSVEPPTTFMAYVYGQ